MGVRPQRFMSGLPRAAIALGVMAVTALCAFSSCQAAEPGVTDKTVKIGILGSLTGPFAIFGTGNLSGATIAFEEANAAGGINGRKLEWISLDDESSPPKELRPTSAWSIKSRCLPFSDLQRAPSARPWYRP